MKGVTTAIRRKDGQIEISIHTPVKGVTIDLSREEQGGEISIHTPVKGVTLHAGSYRLRRFLFQSTHP